MKYQAAFVFIDDGYPEATEYDNNFVTYFPAVSGSYERAVAAAGLGPWKPVPPASSSRSGGIRSGWRRLVAALM